MKKLRTILCGATLCTSLFMTPKNYANILETNIEKEIDEFEQFKTPETNIQIQETEKHVEISVVLPEFKKEDIAVTIEDKTEKDTTKKQLKITAKKPNPDKEKTKDQTKDKEKEEKSQKTDTASTQVTTYQQYSSFKSINGQEQSVHYKNGHMNISIDMPKYVALDKDYEMKFKDNKLVIKFLKIEKKHTKQLSFTK